MTLRALRSLQALLYKRFQGQYLKNTACNRYEVNYNDRTSYVSYYFYCQVRSEGPFKVILGQLPPISSTNGDISADGACSVMLGSIEWPACCTPALAQDGVAWCSKQLEASHIDSDVRHRHVYYRLLMHRYVTCWTAPLPVTFSDLLSHFKMKTFYQNVANKPTQIQQ